MLQRLLPLVEHSIEFQVVFLQHLCAERSYPAHPLRSLRSRHHRAPARRRPCRRRLLSTFWPSSPRERASGCSSSCRTSPTGRRYGDFTAHADQGAMVEVGQRDRERLVRVLRRRGRPTLSGNRRPRSAALTLHLPADVPGAIGGVARYQQWNIDDDSVVSLPASLFARPPAHEEKTFMNRCQAAGVAALIALATTLPRPDKPRPTKPPVQRRRRRSPPGRRRHLRGGSGGRRSRLFQARSQLYTTQRQILRRPSTSGC